QWLDHDGTSLSVSLVLTPVPVPLIDPLPCAFTAPPLGPHPLSPLPPCLLGPHPLSPSPHTRRGGTPNVRRSARTRERRALGVRTTQRYAPLCAVRVRAVLSETSVLRDGSAQARKTHPEARARGQAAPQRDPNGATRVVPATRPRHTRLQIPPPARPARLHRRLLLRRPAARPGA